MSQASRQREAARTRAQRLFDLALLRDENSCESCAVSIEAGRPLRCGGEGIPPCYGAVDRLTADFDALDARVNADPLCEELWRAAELKRIFCAAEETESGECQDCHYYETCPFRIAVAALHSLYGEETTTGGEG